MKYQLLFVSATFVTFNKNKQICECYENGKYIKVDLPGWNHEIKTYRLPPQKVVNRTFRILPFGVVNDKF